MASVYHCFAKEGGGRSKLQSAEHAREYHGHSELRALRNQSLPQERWQLPCLSHIRESRIHRATSRPTAKRTYRCIEAAGSQTAPCSGRRQYFPHHQRLPPRRHPLQTPNGEWFHRFPHPSHKPQSPPDECGSADRPGCRYFSQPLLSGELFSWPVFHRRGCAVVADHSV